MKLEVDVKLDIDVEGFKKMTEDAARMAMRDITVDVFKDAVMDSPIQTGHNRRSLACEVSGMGVIEQGGDATPDRVVDDNEIQGAVFSTSGYGGYLETGTVKMAARPYIKPSVDRNFTEGKFRERVKNYLEA